MRVFGKKEMEWNDFNFEHSTFFNVNDNQSKYIKQSQHTMNLLLAMKTLLYPLFTLNLAGSLNI